MKPMNVMNILKEGKDEEQVCCLCKKKFKGWGNDAWPLADGYCCDECNASKVLPARIAQIYGTKKESAKPNLVYSNDKRVDIDNQGNATVWKDGKIEKSLKVPKNVKGKDYKEYFDKELKEDEEDNYPGLDKTIKVYDIASFIDKEVNEPGADTQYKPHTMDKAAILLKDDGTGCIVDYEAIGSRFDSVDEKVEISLSPKDGDDGQGHRTISIMPTAIVKIPVKELLNAPSTEMKARDFFTKWNYNDRCIQNFNGIKPYLNGSN